MVKMTLKGLRANARLTQRQAAELIGVSPKTVSNWEKGITYPNQKQIEKICEVYGVPYDCIKFVD